MDKAQCAQPWAARTFPSVWGSEGIIKFSHIIGSKISVASFHFGNCSDPSNLLPGPQLSCVYFTWSCLSVNCKL